MKGRRTIVGAALAALLLLTAGPALAQLNMPDPSQISGVPLPAANLPSGSVSVRVIRGSFANNLAGVDVDFIVDGKTTTKKTDEGGHAQVDGLRPGSQFRAVATVSGERLESQAITIGPSGIRFVLAAKADAAATTAGATAPAARGTVVLGEESRIVAEFTLDRLNLYYMMSVMNSASAPVDLGGPLTFELPQGARGVSMMEDATKQATANGPRVTVVGPFAPGATPVNFQFELPYDGPVAHIEQRLPAALDGLQMLALKTGNLDVQSPQLPQKQSTVQQGQPLIVAMGPAVPAGQLIAIDITGLPYHARWPRWLALGLAAIIACAGIWGAAFPVPRTAAARR